MDTHSSHLAVSNRSRSSQSPSPSHSASATSSIHKRKLASEDHAPPFPPSSFSADTRDSALTSNDDLESISARGGGGDSDSDDESEPFGDDDEDFDHDSSMLMPPRCQPNNLYSGSPSGRLRDKSLFNLNDFRDELSMEVLFVFQPYLMHLQECEIFE